MQITGLKSFDDTNKIIQILENRVKFVEGPVVINNDIPVNNEISETIEIQKAISNITEFNIKPFEIVLINSDYFCGYKINREMLYKIIVNEYGIFSTYEPCIYPGVNIKYFWNKNNTQHKGICNCKNKCSGKGNGETDGNCKKITIAAFQSGNVIITGARNKEQINISYNFINSIFKKHYFEIKRNDIFNFENICWSDSDEEEIVSNNKNKKKNKIIMIKKNKIKYPETNIAIIE